MNSKYKALIFDFDGVILDSVNVKTEAFAEMYRPFGTEVEQKVVAHHLEHGGVSRYEKFKIYHKEFLGETIDEAKVQEMAEHFSSLVFEKVVASPFIKGALEFLKEQHDKFLFFVATGTPKIEIDRIVPARDLSKYFHTLYGSPTKKPEIINTILDLHNLNANEVLFIGDAMTDYKAAHECHLDFVGVESDHTTFPEGTIVVNDIMNISNYLYE